MLVNTGRKRATAEDLRARSDKLAVELERLSRLHDTSVAQLLDLPKGAGDRSVVEARRIEISQQISAHKSEVEQTQAPLRHAERREAAEAAAAGEVGAEKEARDQAARKIDERLDKEAAALIKEARALSSRFAKVRAALFELKRISEHDWTSALQGTRNWVLFEPAKSDAVAKPYGDHAHHKKPFKYWLRGEALIENVARTADRYALELVEQNMRLDDQDRTLSGIADRNDEGAA
ncbi:MAG: hypothetical protein MRY74_14535 [Neomegalonema sp.]|nr:hypothetical protein [Neomegalonema sp.]